MCKLRLKPCATEFDGTPCAVKAARTVWSGGKGGDYIKALPIAIGRQVSGHQAADGWRRRHPDRYAARPSAVKPLLMKAPAVNFTVRGIKETTGQEDGDNILFLPFLQVLHLSCMLKESFL